MWRQGLHRKLGEARGEGGATGGERGGRRRDPRAALEKNSIQGAERRQVDEQYLMPLQHLALSDDETLQSHAPPHTQPDMPAFHRPRVGKADVQAPWGNLQRLYGRGPGCVSIIKTTGLYAPAGCIVWCVSISQ